MFLENAGTTIENWKAWAGSMQGEKPQNIPIWYYPYELHFFSIIVHYSNPLHSNKSSKWPQLNFCHFCSSVDAARPFNFADLCK